MRHWSGRYRWWRIWRRPGTTPVIYVISYLTSHGEPTAALFLNEYERDWAAVRLNERGYAYEVWPGCRVTEHGVKGVRDDVAHARG